MKQIKDFPIKEDISDDDLILIQDNTNGAYFKTTKASLLAGISSSSGLSTIPTYISLPLTETSGNTAVDASGNNRNGTYVNASLNSNGVILDGSSRISLNNSHTALSTLTIGLEFKTNATSNQGLWEFRASQDLSSGIYTPSLIIRSDGAIKIYGYPSGSDYVSQNFNDDSWHKSIVTLSSSNIKIFVDKTKILDISANPITVFTGFFSLGATRANGSFTGQLKNFRVWDFIMSDSQGVEYS